MGIQRVSSKWTKTVVLQRRHIVNEYMPVTRKYSRHTLERMTELFECNYIKPDRGTYGNGVMRVKTTRLYEPVVNSEDSTTDAEFPEEPNHRNIPDETKTTAVTSRATHLTTTYSYPET